MKKLTLSLCGMIITATALSANVPYSFSPNTPAKASEVNENFKSLSTKINTVEKNTKGVEDGIRTLEDNIKALKDNIKAVENNVTGLTSSLASNNPSDGSSASTDVEDCDKSPLKYTYTYIPSNIGDTITVGGKEYIMVAAPFYEYGTGDRYYIKYPREKNDFAESGTRFTMQTTYASEDANCYTHSFSGYPSSENSITYNTNYRQYGLGAYADFVVEDDVYFYTHMKINKTSIYLSFSAIFTALEKEVSRKPYLTGDFDLRDDIDWSNFGVDNNLVENIKELLNYVQVVKMQ